MTGASAFLCAAIVLTGCRSGASIEEAELAPLDESPIFSSSEYGVPVSPRVTNLKRVPRGGGREQVGKPYQVRGQWYHPKEEPGYVARGKASWYGSNFHGRLTANGEIYDMYHLSAAHPTFPLPSYARVTNKTNGRSILVRVNDRGPYAHGRVVDVSQRAAEVLDFRTAGIADVKVEYVGRAPLEGDDEPMLLASFRRDNASPANDGLPSGVMVASNVVPAPSATAVSYNGGSIFPTSAPRASSAIGQAVRDGVAGSPASVAVPMPTMRDAALSYAAAPARSGAFQALARIVSTPATPGDRIEIGAIEDIELLLRVHALTQDRGRLVGDEDAGASSLALVVNPGESADDILRSLWQAGATDAFVLRD